MAKEHLSSMDTRKRRLEEIACSSLEPFLTRDAGLQKPATSFAPHK